MIKQTTPRCALCTCISIFLLLAGTTFLILWLIYRPHKPQFAVIGTAIYNLNTSSVPLISTSMQLTIATRNPNPRVSIYYDKLSAFIAYKDQAITSQVMISPFFHRRKRTVTISPVFGGDMVPVSIEVANGLVVDEQIGVVGLRLLMFGRIRWKAGAVKSRHYRIYVRCDLLVGLKKGFVGRVPLLGSNDCSVDV